MPIPLRQNMRIGSHLLRQKLKGDKHYPFIVEIEPLFACNLSCPGCGKIQHPTDILRKRLSVEDIVDAVEESGTPMVSIAGGEPLLHPDIDAHRRRAHPAQGLRLPVHQRRAAPAAPRPLHAVALLLLGRPHRRPAASATTPPSTGRACSTRRWRPSGRPRQKGFRVTTNSTFFNTDSPKTVRDVLDFLNDDLEVDAMMISPGLRLREGARPGALPRRRADPEAVPGGLRRKQRKKWRLNHSPLFLDFLEGKTDFQCTAWGIPSYSVLGWQRPCYLMADGYATSYKELVETTDWDAYGRGKDPRCANCMAHCGYEPTSVIASMGSLRQSLRALVNTH